MEFEIVHAPKSTVFYLCVNQNLFFILGTRHKRPYNTNLP